MVSGDSPGAGTFRLAPRGSPPRLVGGAAPQLKKLAHRAADHPAHAAAVRAAFTLRRLRRRSFPAAAAVHAPLAVLVPAPRTARATPIFAGIYEDASLTSK